MGWVTRNLMLLAFTAHMFLAAITQASPCELSGSAAQQDQPHQAQVHAPDQTDSLLFTLSREWDGNAGWDRVRSAQASLDRVVQSTTSLAGTTGDSGFSLVAHCDRHACRSSLAFFGRLIPLRN